MDTKEQIESVVFHQAQCLSAVEDLKMHLKDYQQDYTINKLKDLEKELRRLTIQLRGIEDQIQ